MLQPSPVPATPFAERLSAGAGRRTLGIGLALLVEGLLLLLLLSFGPAEQPGEKDGAVTVVRLASPDADEPEPSSSERERQAEERPVQERPAPEEPPPPQPVEPKAVPMPPILPAPRQPPPPAAIPPAPVPPATPNRPAYGPPDKRSAASRDTERVGTAPNGEPLYAAAWYREPRDDELSGYLSTARGPGWGLIACRTAPDYRVEDCVGIAEYPEGSQITRAVLAAAWQFKVRPPRLGGRPQVGSWVSIRIDYGIRRR